MTSLRVVLRLLLINSFLDFRGHICPEVSSGNYAVHVARIKRIRYENNVLAAGGSTLLLLLFVGSHIPLVGCNDESRTSGTQVEVSEQVQAHRKARAESYKGDLLKNRLNPPNPPLRESSQSRHCV